MRVVEAKKQVVLVSIRVNLSIGTKFILLELGRGAHGRSSWRTSDAQLLLF